MLEIEDAHLSLGRSLSWLCSRNLCLSGLDSSQLFSQTFRCSHRSGSWSAVPCEGCVLPVVESWNLHTLCLGTSVHSDLAFTRAVDVEILFPEANVLPPVWEPSF